METLLNTKFSKLLSGLMPAGENTPGIEKLYRDFAQALFAFCKSEGDMTKLFFALNYTYIEFVSLHAEYGSGEK